MKECFSSINSSRTYMYYGVADLKVSVPMRRNRWRIRKRRNHRKKMLVRLDPQDFVISVERELSEIQMPEIKTQICKGPYHNKGGRGTSLPIENFPTNRYHPDRRTKTCGVCLEKSGKRNSVSEKDMI